MWFARFSSVERSSPGGFWDFGMGATLGGLDEFVRERFLGVMVLLLDVEGKDGDGGGIGVDILVFRGDHMRTAFTVRRKYLACD